MKIIKTLTSLPKYIWVMVFLLIIALFLWTISAVFVKKPLRLINSLPADKAENININLKTVEFFFNKNLKNPNQVTVNINPPIRSLSSFGTQKNILLLQLNQKLSLKTKYTLSLLDAKTKKPIANLEFTTIALENKGFGDPNIGQRLWEKDQEDFPLLHWVPYVGKNFSADYLGAKKLQVKITTNQEAAQKELGAWFLSHRVDINTHELVFVPK